MTLKASSPLSLIKKKNASAIQVPDGVVLRAAKAAHFFGEKALMSNEQLDCSHVCTSRESSLNHSWSFKFQIHQLTAGNISRSPVLRNSWVNMSQKMEHERQLDSSIACAEAKSSDDHSRLRGCKGFGHLAGWKALARAQGDVKMMRNGIILQTYHRYIHMIYLCVALCLLLQVSYRNASFLGMLCLVSLATTVVGPKVLDRVSFNLLLGSLEERKKGGLVDCTTPPIEDMRRSIWSSSFWYYYRCDKCDDSTDSDILTRIMHIMNCSFQWTFCPA